MLRIHEQIRADGELAPVYLRADGARLRLVTADRADWVVQVGMLEAVMRRYGAPFDPGAAVARIASLECDGFRLSHLRHLAGYDVIARDYLLLEKPSAEPLCALSTTVAGALEHLVRAAHGASRMQ